MDALDISDVLELIEICQDTLDEIWKQDLHKVYPENRMRQLMLAIGRSYLLFFICHSLSDLLGGKAFRLQNFKPIAKFFPVCEI